MRLQGSPARRAEARRCTLKRAPRCFRFVAQALACCCGLQPAVAATFSYHVLGAPGPWTAILSSVGLTAGPSEGADVIVAPSGAGATMAEWAPRVEAGAILIVEGGSALAGAYGFRPTASRVTVRSVEDLRAPKLAIVWEKALDLPVFETPAEAQVFARERWQKAPLMAGLRRGRGAVLWIAAAPGVLGYERFPYLPQALADLGLAPAFRSRDLWAFFDSSYRARADLDYLAPKWRAAGIAALHVAAWHYWERDPAADEYLRRLLDACHRNAILVYAWIELPHVSQKFWDQHPEWREKTALLQDAQLDWRRLMNLSHPDAAEAVSAGLSELMNRFDWDGVNLAELYFESLEGHDNPARFTPMNDDVRAAFRKLASFDPRDLFDESSGRHWTKNTAGLKQFLDFRAELAARQQTEWLARIEEIRKHKPHLDVALTHVDDRFDASMREKIGANAARLLPLLAERDFTFLIEDPATIWNLGPQRYPQIAARYQPLTTRPRKLAIDINVVERYQDVYPTKQQTGTELFELVHQAALAFPRVALYFENSLAAADLELLSASASAVESAETAPGRIVTHSKRPAGVRWSGAALVDGKPWPVSGADTVWLPPGTHTIQAAPKPPAVRLLDFNGELTSASAELDSIEFAYRTSARALAVVERAPRRVEIDGVEAHPVLQGNVLVLPKGQHLVMLAP